MPPGCFRPSGLPFHLPVLCLQHFRTWQQSPTISTPGKANRLRGALGSSRPPLHASPCPPASPGSAANPRVGPQPSSRQGGTVLPPYHPLTLVKLSRWLHCTPGIVQMMSRNILESGCIYCSSSFHPTAAGLALPLTEAQGRPPAAEQLDTIPLCLSCTLILRKMLTFKEHPDIRLILRHLGISGQEVLRSLVSIGYEFAGQSPTWRGLECGDLGSALGSQQPPPRCPRLAQGPLPVL